MNRTALGVLDRNLDKSRIVKREHVNRTQRRIYGVHTLTIKFYHIYGLMLSYVLSPDHISHHSKLKSACLLMIPSYE